MEFHIIINGESVGPHTKEEIESMLDENSLRPNDQIWHEDSEGWQSIEQVFDIKTVKLPPPVPLSPPPLPTPASVRSSGGGEFESPSSKEQTKQSNTVVLALIAAVSVVALISIGTLAFVIYQSKVDYDKTAEIYHGNSESMDQRQAKIQKNLNDEVEALQRELQPTESVAAPTSEPPMRQTPNVSATDRGKIADRLKLIGPKILGIQLGDDVEQVCLNFDAENAEYLNGQKMEVRKMSSDGSLVCSTPDGIRAAAQIDGQMNQSNDNQSGGDLAGALLSGLFGGLQGVLQANLTEAPIIYANEKGTITKYVISPTAVTNFFPKASFASNQEFAGFLSAKYGLPDLRPEVVEVRIPLSDSTEYVPKYHGFSSEGYSVKIDEHKAIFIEEL